MLTTTGTVTADVRRLREQARSPPMTNSEGRHIDIDIAFVAECTPRRERLIAGASALLWEWRTDLEFTGSRGPAHARIVLSIHGGDELDFDWRGAADAIANGCVIVSETSVGFEPLVPGVHFLMAPYENVVERAVALAFDEPRRAAMAEAALQMAEMARTKVPQAAATEQPSSKRGRFRRKKSASPSAATGTLQQLVTELKIAIVAQRELRRSIEATISVVEHGDPNHADLVSTSSWSSFDAEVSVVVLLSNEGHRLRETVDSVIAASGDSGPRTELLIVDDHSTDNSREIAEQLLAEIDWYPAMLIARAANGGTAVARNVGFNTARAPHVLALHAGSTLYPTGLRRLLDGLHDAPTDVVATYGLVERFDTTGSLGLSGHLPWDIELLVNGEFPDTVAMFRRDAWSDLGGYTTPTGGVEDDWEQYDLWLSVAERGLRAGLVGSVIGRHRQPLASMLNVSKIDTASTFITLRERHPRLPWPS
jgi:Glycosyl transferase family 2